MGGMVAGFGVLVMMVAAGELGGKCTSGVNSSPEHIVCCIRADTWATNSSTRRLSQAFS